MLYYLKRYPLSLSIIVLIFYLSLFNPPQTSMSEISNIDKVAHLCMYGGLCLVLWWEYLRNHHSTIHWSHMLFGGILAPITMSGIIELLQAYATENRSGEWLDFLANSTGVTLAALIGYYLIRPWMIRREKEKEKRR